MALGSLYAPAIKELSSGKFRDAKSNFLNLVTLVKRSKVFQAYHSTKMAERNKQLEAQRQERNKRISVQRNELKNTIKKTILRIKTRINADPFSEDAAILSQIFKKYQRTPQGISLSQLRERLKALSIKLDKYEDLTDIFKNYKNSHTLTPGERIYFSSVQGVRCTQSSASYCTYSTIIFLYQIPQLFSHDKINDYH